MRWPYLSTEDYHIRQHISEWYMRDMPTVVEIGPNGNGVKVSGHYRAIDWLSEAPDDIGRPYGLVYLGVDIEGGEEEIAAFHHLVRGASVCVIEAATDYPVGSRQMREVIATSRMEVVARFEIYLPDHGEHSARSMVVLRSEQ